MMINGSNARTYSMALVDQDSKNPGPALWVVATDGGYLDKPVKIDPTAKANNTLTMMSGERYWVVVDFNGFKAGKVGPNGQPYSGNWLLKNNAKSPFPAGAAAQGTTTARIMQFRVKGTPVADASFNPASGAPLRAPMVHLANNTPAKIRQLTLNEVMGAPKTAIDPVTGATLAFPGGPLEVLVNNTKWGGERITGVDPMGMFMLEPIPGFTPDSSGVNYLSETPKEGETELWEIVNLTADAHPIHLHLVQFQLVNRQNYNTNSYNKAYAAAFQGGYDYSMGLTMPAGQFIAAYGPPKSYDKAANPLNARADGGNPDVVPFLQGAPTAPLPQESGWKDTVIMYPGQVTRIMVRWAPTDLPANTPAAQASFPFNPFDNAGYVWHCHIVDHEDNEMMRPNEVQPNPNAARTLFLGTDY